MIYNIKIIFLLLLSFMVITSPINAQDFNDIKISSNSLKKIKEGHIVGSLIETSNGNNIIIPNKKFAVINPNNEVPVLVDLKTCTEYFFFSIDNITPRGIRREYYVNRNCIRAKHNRSSIKNVWDKILKVVE